MIPSLVKRLSSSLSFGKSSPAAENGEKESGKKRRKNEEDGATSASAEDISSLRRQSTHELINNDGDSPLRTTSRIHAVASVRQVTKQLSGRSTSVTSIRAQESAKKLSKTGSGTKSVSRTSSTASARASLNGQKAASLSKRTSSATKANAAQKKSSMSQKKLSECAPSLQKSSSKSSISSGKGHRGSEATKKDGETGRKQLWFPAGVHLAVRKPEGTYPKEDFYLCRNVRNIYNYTKEAPINWLVKKRNKKSVGASAFLYSSGYRDRVDTLSILMQVNLHKVSGRQHVLPADQEAEILKLVRLSEDVVSGKMSISDVDDDVEPIVLIDEPPAKKPKLRKTASQKLRDKAIRTASKKTKEPKAKTGEKKAKKVDGEPKRKKPTKKEADLELHPKLYVKVLEEDPLFETRTPMPYISKVANSRLIYRAIYLKDNKLLTKLLKSGNLIYQLFCKSVDNRDSPLSEAVKMKDGDIFETIMKNYIERKFKDRYTNNKMESTMLNKLQTGSYNERSLGIRFIRKIMASRGSREGNNAFLKPERNADNEDIDDVLLTPGAYKFFEEKGKTAHVFDMPIRHVTDFLLLGENIAAGDLISMDLDDYRSNFNNLYKEVLLNETEELTSCSPANVRAIAKRVNQLSPFHCAATNPNGAYLKKLLSVQADVHITDKQGCSPTHYAAACSSTEPLKILLQWGGNPNQADNLRKIPLHYAILANRPDNVRFLLEEAQKGDTDDAMTEKFGVGGINRRENTSRTPLHLAVEHVFFEVTEILLEYEPDINAKLNVRENQTTPLMLAAGQGDLRIVRLLVDNGAVVEQTDRLGRSAVIHACMNGATNVLSYLLHIGASAERADNSGNTPLHYACAYGWYFTVTLLLQSGGVDPNVPNMWRTTPIAVAYFKGHIGIVREMLNNNKVDINFPDDSGVTMIFHACTSDLEQEDLCEQIRYMIEEKRAKCSVKDNEGKTPLHYLAHVTVRGDSNEPDPKKYAKTKADAHKQSVEIAKLLLKNGCDIDAVDDAGFTATMTAVARVNNYPLAQFLLKEGGKILPPQDGNTTTMLHQMALNMWEGAQNLTRLLDLVTEDDLWTGVIKKMLNFVDSNGYTPVLYTILKADHTQAGYSVYMKELKQGYATVHEFIKQLVKLGADLNAKVKHIPESTNPDSDTGKNAAHLALFSRDPIIEGEQVTVYNSGQLFRTVVKLGADVNVRTQAGQTVLAECLSDPHNHCVKQNGYQLLDFLLKEAKCDFNLPVETTLSNKKVTLNPLLYACIKAGDQADLIKKLIDCGCDITAMFPGTQQSCLHYLLGTEVNGRDVASKILDKLVEKGFNINGVDAKKQTALHRAVSNNAGSMNESYEVEVKLIRLGANFGLTDDVGRTALHYVFIKETQQSGFGRYNFFGRHQQQSTDPAELAKLIGRNMKKEQINIQDSDGRTALHYAAKSGATVSCMYLLMIGANVNLEDKDGNTTLSLAVQASHDNCATTLIQSGANLLSKVVFKSQSDSGQTNTDSEEIESQEIWQWQVATLIEKEAKGERKIPLYQAAIELDLSGVAMFVTEADLRKSGLTDTDAITMALMSCKYNIAMRLLSTCPDLKILQKLGQDNRNLLHVLALSTEHFASRADQMPLMIAEYLITAGVPIKAADAWKCSPIQYAILNRHHELAKLLAEKSGGFDVHYTDGFNRSYVAAALWKCHSGSIGPHTWDFIEGLIKKKININKLFDMPLNAELTSLQTRGTKVDPDYWKSYPENKTTALITAISCNDFIISHNFLAWGANPNLADGNKLTPLMHAVKQNKPNNVKQLLNYSYDPNEVPAPKPIKAPKQRKQAKMSFFKLKVTDDEDESSNEDEEEDEDDGNKSKEDEKAEKEEFRAVKKTSAVNVNAKDGAGRTALHYVSQPHQLGTFDNAEIAFVLVNAGAKLMEDNRGVNPYHLALTTGAKKVAQVLKKHFKLTDRSRDSLFDRSFPVDDGLGDRLKDLPDFTAAAEKTLRRYDSSMEVEEKFVHKVDERCNVTNGELVKDEEQDMYYDALLTKVDVKQGYWGLYNFYQLQLVYQSTKSLFILFTRWGRINDQGQFQHTPFNTKEEGVKEFMKIFKEKTGNKWTDVKQFEHKPKKYKLVDDVARKAPAPHKDIEFTLDSPHQSVLPKHLQNFIAVLMNPKAIQISMKNSSVLNTESLPFGQLNRERLLQGKQLLDQIEKLVADAETSKPQAESSPEELDAYRETMEKIAELSNEYFHIIPQKNFVFEKIHPLDTRQRLMVQIYALLNLLDYEIVCKMLLAAMHYRKDYNPKDYVYGCLNCQIEPMNQDDFMSQIILKYIWTGKQNLNPKVHGIYKLSREGESERLEATGLGDRRFLWHGSSSCNLLSIFHRGLLVAPPEASASGWAYGKGIYFSDAFAMSSNYIRSQKTKFMLLCEVALGKSKSSEEKSEEENAGTKPKDDWNTVVVPSSYCYEPSDWLILSSGASIPCGNMQGGHWRSSTYSQYVVRDPAQVCLTYLVHFTE